MILYDYTNIENVYVLGDVHGEFSRLFNKMKMHLSLTKRNDDVKVEKHPLVAAEEDDFEMMVHRLDLEIGGLGGMIPPKRKCKTRKENVNIYDNSIFIVCGDCGIGFNKFAYYEQVFGGMNELLSNCNSTLLLVRGNHDDPKYFTEKMIDMSNIKCIPDYSVVKTSNKNILCIGGGISVDRMWRKQEELRINRWRNVSSQKHLYWKDEPIVKNIEAIDEILNNGIEITHVITHSAPTFAFPYQKDTALSWFRVDGKLKEDIELERNTLTDIFRHLKAKSESLKLWCYGHFHSECSEEHDNVLFQLLNDNLHIFSLDELLANHEYDKKMKEMKMKVGQSKFKTSETEPIDYDALGFGEAMYGEEHVNVLADPFEDGNNNDVEEMDF